MNFEKFQREEEEVQKLLQSKNLKQPPDFLMEHFAEEVRQKIELRKQKKPFGFSSFSFYAVPAMALTGLLVFLLYPAITKQRMMLIKTPINAPSVSEKISANSAAQPSSGEALSRQTVSEQPSVQGVSSDLDKAISNQVIAGKMQAPSQVSEKIDEATLEKMSQNLLILEALGETEGIDEGLLENDDRIQSEMDLFEQNIPMF